MLKLLQKFLNKNCPRTTLLGCTYDCSAIII